MQRCRLSWLTNSALVYEPKWGEGGKGGGVAGSQSMSIAVHRSPNKLWRSNSILTYAPLWFEYRPGAALMGGDFLLRHSDENSGQVLLIRYARVQLHVIK
jgi:hypothetical protein